MEEQDIYFEVTEQPVYVNGETVAQYKALVREDTKNVLAIHNRTYNLVLNSTVFPAFQKAVEQSSLGRQPFEFKDYLSHGGGRTIRIYTFPGERFEVTPNDKVVLRLAVTNSYDGSYAFTSIIGGWREFANTSLIIGSAFSQSYGRHTTNLDIQKAANKLEHVADVFHDQKDKWIEWANTEVTDNAVMKFIEGMPFYNESFGDRVFRYYKQESDMLGTTVWALYNALAYWATHEKLRGTSDENKAAVVIDREAKVRRILNSKAWSKMVDAAKQRKQQEAA